MCVLYMPTVWRALHAIPHPLWTFSQTGFFLLPTALVLCVCFTGLYTGVVWGVWMNCPLSGQGLQGAHASLLDAACAVDLVMLGCGYAHIRVHTHFLLWDRKSKR